jgi:hypothetical protein
MSTAGPHSARAHAGAWDFADDLTRIRDTTLNLVFAGDLIQVRHDVRDLASSRAAARMQRSIRDAPAWVAWLLAAVRLLPAADRARYAEEYRSELWDLTRPGAGRLRQLGYVMRQLVRILPMCFVLRAPRHRSPAP